MRVFEGFTITIVLLIGMRCSLVEGPRSLSRDRLESQEIQELVKSALKSSSPCFELVTIKSGAVHIENGIKYQFQLLTAPKPTCNATYYGNHESNLTVHLPESQFARPVFSVG